MQMKYMTTRINLYRENDSPIFGESVTTLEVDDEGAGIFLKISQSPNDFGNGGELRFDFNEIKELFAAIEFIKDGIETGNGEFA